MKANSFRAGQTFSWFPSKKAVFHNSGYVFKPANEALDPSLKPTRDETRWPSAQNNKPAEVLRLKRENDEKSVHLQVLQILHNICFTDVNSETKTHFFLVKFLNSTSDYMNFRVFHPRGVTRINFTWQLVKFGPITMEIMLVKPIKFTLVYSHTSITHLRHQITTGFFTMFTGERFMHQSIPAVPMPPPPRANPRALAFF